jgi:hypothetical protein
VSNPRPRFVMLGIIRWGQGRRTAYTAHPWCRLFGVACALLVAVDFGEFFF